MPDSYARKQGFEHSTARAAGESKRTFKNSVRAEVGPRTLFDLLIIVRDVDDKCFENGEHGDEQDMIDVASQTKVQERRGSRVIKDCLIWAARFIM